MCNFSLLSGNFFDQCSLRSPFYHYPGAATGLIAERPALRLIKRRLNHTPDCAAPDNLVPPPTVWVGFAVISRINPLAIVAIALALCCCGCSGHLPQGAPVPVAQADTAGGSLCRCLLHDAATRNRQCRQHVDGGGPTHCRMLRSPFPFRPMSRAKLARSVAHLYARRSSTKFCDGVGELSR